jgi:hypothetical protein
VCLKQDKASWGAPKIGEKLVRSYPDVHTPAIGTVHPVLDRHGLVKRRMGRRNRAKGTPLSLPGQPNDLWCADYNGEFMLADRRYCYPLTITDFASHDLFACEALATTKEAYTFPVFDAVFKEYGLPNAIRTDNGDPFASPDAAQHELPVGAIPSIKASLHRPAQRRLPVSRQDRHRDHMRAHLLEPAQINLSAVFAGQSVGIKQVIDQIWVVSFMDYDLGYFDHSRLEPLRTKNVTYVSRIKWGAILSLMAGNPLVNIA